LLRAAWEARFCLDLRLVFRLAMEWLAHDFKM
jgi:hypothetical protein